jgi:hypothetical protein
MILKSSTIVRDSENSEKRQVCQASPNLMSPTLPPYLGEKLQKRHKLKHKHKKVSNEEINNFPQ